MKNEIQIFNNEEFGKVRTTIIDGEPFFVGKDLVNILGYRNGSRDINRHVDEDDRRKAMIFDGNQNKETILINESGLYSLILSSKLPSARKFKHWVTSEVLPAIRKTGSYAIQEKPDSYMIENPVERAKRWIEEYEEKVALEEKIKKDEPLVEFANKVSQTSNSIDIGAMAKLLNDEHIPIGRNRLYEWLRKNNYIRKNNEPYQKYINSGIFESVEYVYHTPYGEKTGTKTLITGKGQIYITEKLRKFYDGIAEAESGDIIG